MLIIIDRSALVRLIFGVFAALASLLAESSPVQSASDSRLCSSLVTTLVPQLIFRRPISELRRVELRACDPDRSGNLQIAAWTQNAAQPSLIVSTDDFSITELAMSHNIFVIQTARDAYETVSVISFENGIPKLAMQSTVRDAAKIVIDSESVSVTLTDAGGHSKSFKYRVSAE